MEAYCKTPRQLEVIRALEANNGNFQKTAKQLKTDVSAIHKTVKRVKALAARQGHSPEHDMTRTVPDGYKLKGTSTLYGKDGALKLQWVKSDIDAERQLEIMTEIVGSLTADIPARANQFNTTHFVRPSKPLHHYRLSHRSVVVGTRRRCRLGYIHRP